MNKLLKYGLLTYTGLVVVKGIELAIKNKALTAYTEEAHGYSVLRDNGLMKLHGLKVAAAMIFTDGSKRIVVDEHFFALPLSAQRAVLAHEQAHIDLGHLDKLSPFNMLKRSLIASTGGVQDIEVEADAYAAKKVGKIALINALTCLLDIKGFNKQEFHRRIELLS